MGGQGLTIALVVTAGIGSFIALQSTWDSLVRSRDIYYARYRFGDVFAGLERAPNLVAKRLQRIPGVARVATSVRERVRVPMKALAEPASGLIVSRAAGRSESLGALHLAAGRRLRPNAYDEAILLEAFAEEHQIKPGDHLSVVINGALRELRIVGLALSPEFIFPRPPGRGAIFSDPRRFAVLWMNREAVAAAFDMEGGFNYVVLDTQPGALTEAVIERVDTILSPYGGLGAVSRTRQASHDILEGELRQLRQLAVVVPILFLGVAAFLLHVVLSRLVALQRTQIAALKALGYETGRVGRHYIAFAGIIVVVGATLGVAVGAALGHALVGVYAAFFRFPVLLYQLTPKLVLISISVSLTAAIAGALSSVWRTVRLPPAEAMRPPAPPTYRPTLLERVGLDKLLSPSSRMVLRELERQPLRTLLSSGGVALAIGILVVGRFYGDAIEMLIDVQFYRAWREDMEVGFFEPMPLAVTQSLEAIPGVLDAEGMRAVPVRFRVQHRRRDSAILAYSADGDMRQVVNSRGKPVPLPLSGIVLSRKLAEILKVRPGAVVTVDIREGEWRTIRMRVAGTVDDTFGLFGYMRLRQFHRQLGAREAISSALLRIDPVHRDAIRRRLNAMPSVASVATTESNVRRFREQSAQVLDVMTLVVTILATVIAVGIVYNNARITLSTRSRDLASLRVMGFTRGEISAILLGELAVQWLIAVPAGLVIGSSMAQALLSTVDPEQYRFPLVITSGTYAFAVSVTLGAALLSALLVRRRLDHLDLIGVLKTRE